jgi:hypothetical protein
MRILWTAAALAGLSAPAAAAQPYDGTWNVAIQTKAGSCDPTANYAVTVTEGKVSGPANVSGTVGPSGKVRVSIGAAYPSGQLAGSRGPANGTLPVAECRAAVAGRLRKSDATLRPPSCPHGLARVRNNPRPWRLVWQ